MRYNNLSSNLRLWYPELTCIRDKNFTLFFGKIPLSVPLWTRLISTWFSLAGSRHSLTLPLSFSMRMKLLHHSTISSIPKGFTMSCCWTFSNSSFNGFCSAVVHMLCALGALGMVNCLALPAMKMSHQNTLHLCPHIFKLLL